MSWLRRGLAACRVSIRRAFTRHLDRTLLIGAALALAATFLNPVATVDRALFDQVIVLDITQSMNVTDYQLEGKPVSRLSYAKHALRQLLLELPCGSTQSEPEILKKGTLASPAIPLASKVLPVPGGPTSSKPRGIRPPSFWNFCGSFRRAKVAPKSWPSRRTIARCAPLQPILIAASLVI